MAFWDKWFKPKPNCSKCGGIIHDDPVEVDGQTLHPACHKAMLEAEARRAEQEAALRALEERNRVPQRAPTPPAPPRRGSPFGPDRR